MDYRTIKQESTNLKLASAYDDDNQTLNITRQSTSSLWYYRSESSDSSLLTALNTTTIQTFFPGRSDRTPSSYPSSVSLASKSSRRNKRQKNLKSDPRHTKCANDDALIDILIVEQDKTQLPSTDDEDTVMADAIPIYPQLSIDTQIIPPISTNRGEFQ